MSIFKILTIVSATLTFLVGCQNGTSLTAVQPEETISTSAAVSTNYSDIYHRYLYVKPSDSRISYVLPIRTKLERLVSLFGLNIYEVKFSYWSEGSMRRMILTDTVFIPSTGIFTANGKKTYVYKNQANQLSMRIYESNTYWAEYETRVVDGPIF
jgi:hypothetical protein